MKFSEKKEESSIKSRLNKRQALEATKNSEIYVCRYSISLKNGKKNFWSVLGGDYMM